MHFRVYGNVKGSLRGVPDEGAFVADLLARLRKGEIEQVWRILNFYDYDRELRLLPASHVSIRSDGTEGLELSEDGVAFLEDTLLHYSQVGSTTEVKRNVTRTDDMLQGEDRLQADNVAHLFALLPGRSGSSTSLNQRQWLDSWMCVCSRLEDVD